MINKIVKRDGRAVEFDLDKITQAIYKAAHAIGGNDYEAAEQLADKVREYLEAEFLQADICEQAERIIAYHGMHCFVNVMYDATLKVWVEGYKATSKGRFIGTTGEYIIWEEGAQVYWG